MELKRLSVAVVGGAIGGASTALLLARRGAKVTLFERVPHPKAVGAGIALQPNGLAVLFGLGLRDRILARAARVQAARVVDGRGRVLVAPTFPTEPNGLDHLLTIRRSDLHEALLDAVGADPRIQLRLGAEVTQTGRDGSLLVRTDAGDTEERFDLIVGADGVHSRVRQSGDFGAKVRRTGIWYLRGMSPRDLARDEEAWTSAGIFGSFRVPDGTYFFCSAASRPVSDAVKARDLAALREAYAAAYPPSRELLADVDSFDSLLLNEVTRVDCARYFDGACVLLGDAAHAMAPNLGQGANSALVDAAVLVDALAASDTLGAALARYDARRRPAVRAVQDAAGMLGRISDRTGPAFRWFRDRALRLLATAGGEKRTAQALQEPPAELLRIAGAA